MIVLGPIAKSPSGLSSQEGINGSVHFLGRVASLGNSRWFSANRWKLTSTNTYVLSVISLL